MKAKTLATVLRVIGPRIESGEQLGVYEKRLLALALQLAADTVEAFGDDPDEPVSGADLVEELGETINAIHEVFS